MSDALDNQLVVAAVRPAMERQRQSQRSTFGGRQEHPVAAKIVEPDPFVANGVEQLAEAPALQQLAWKEVMALQAGIVARRPPAVNRTKGNARAIERAVAGPVIA